MKRDHIATSEMDRHTFDVVRTFVFGRLAEPEILDWAVRLKGDDHAERVALRSVFDIESEKLATSWVQAWQLLFESWETGEAPEDHGGLEYDIQRRLARGDRSGDLVSAIVDLARPVLQVEFRLASRSKKFGSARVKSANDLLSFSMRSNHPVDPEKLGIATVREGMFLGELAEELDAALSKAISISNRIGQADNPWWLGIPRRVYWVPESQLEGDEHEPDEFSTGVAGVTKLLMAVVEQLATTGVSQADRFVARWGRSTEPLHKRMWCAAARRQVLASPREVYQFLASCDSQLFWSVETSPEVAEVRALRFNHFDDVMKLGLCRRIRRGPPRSFWAKDIDANTANGLRLNKIAKELQRIELAGGELPESDKAWLGEYLRSHPNLQLASLDDDFYSFKRARWVGAKPDARFDLLDGGERLRLLEMSLSETRRSWKDDPAERASDWVRSDRNASLLIDDFDRSGDLNFPLVLDRFGWAHRPIKVGEQISDVSRDEGLRVLQILERMPAGLIEKAIDGISSWLDGWSAHLSNEARLASVWLRMWPAAARATNRQTDPLLDPLNTNVRGGAEDEPGDLDVLNTAAGRMIGAFLAMCPALHKGDRPFVKDGPLWTIRELAAGERGRAGLIAKYRLLQHLTYFFTADEEWVRSTLIPPLDNGGMETRMLWRAVASSSRPVVGVLGDRVVARATDAELSRKVRSRLAVGVAIDALHSLLSKKPPSVDLMSVTQMLRSVDEDVRVDVAQIVQRFVVGNAKDDANYSPEVIFDQATKPFLERVWPLEIALVSPATSRAFADVPAASGERFVEAVALLKTRLVPFESWSLHDYGVRDLGGSLLLKINSAAKAAALLDLLDMTISGADGVAVPMELDEALGRIAELAPKVVSRPSFRRLSAIARR